MLKQCFTGTFLRYHRPDVLKVLIDHIPPQYKVHFNRRLLSFAQNPSGVELLFEDGSRERCNLLIGADGIKSVVRRGVLTEQAAKARKAGRHDDAEDLMRRIDPKWTGIVAYRALIPTERLAAYRDEHPEENVRIPTPKSTPIMVRSLHISFGPHD